MAALHGVAPAIRRCGFPATEVFMTVHFRMTIAVVVLAGFAGTARAEEAKPQAAAPDAFPQACRTAGPAPSARPDHSSMKSMTGAEHLFMQGMSKMNDNMMQGMMKDDVDMAFICGMIAHHEGAIAMARAELDHGKEGPLGQATRANRHRGPDCGNSSDERVGGKA